LEKRGQRKIKGRSKEKIRAFKTCGRKRGDWRPCRKKGFMGGKGENESGDENAFPGT